MNAIRKRKQENKKIIKITIKKIIKVEVANEDSKGNLDKWGLKTNPGDHLEICVLVPSANQFIIGQNNALINIQMTAVAILKSLCFNI